MTNSLPDYERWAELERELAKTQCSSDQLMLIIEGQDANYERMLKELSEAKVEITRLRAIPRPPKPLFCDVQDLWEQIVQHYEQHLKGETK